MPAYARSADGEVVERVITEPGSHADLEHARLATADGSPWSIDAEPPEEQPAPVAPQPAPAGRPPRGPNQREEKADG